MTRSQRSPRAAPDRSVSGFRPPWPSVVVIALVALVAYGCRSSAPPGHPSALSGLASWYGEEFAGRTTANGEIFDPSLLTAAHRTLPFGTVLDVTNPGTQQTVRVRVNDRGPYIANRILDLSYAAARHIGLVEPGVGNVTIRVVQLGAGEREPPAPFDVAISPSTPPAATPRAGEPPPVVFPLPGGGTADTTVERVDVEVQRGSVITRRQVSTDGTTIEEVPIGTAPATSRPAASPASRPSPPRSPSTAGAGRFHVQVGAFAQEANALALQERLALIGEQARIDRSDLYRIRIGPFQTRDEALRARSRLEANGISAIIVTD